MNMHVTPTSGAASPCLFKAGDFVRLKSMPKVVGRVLADTHDTTTIKILDGGGSWQEGETERFGPGCLAMWTADEGVPVAQRPFDFEVFTTLSARLVGSYDLMDTLCQALRSSDDQAAELDNFLNNMENIADTYGEVACQALDMLHQREDKN
jgi:hypothetical protein